MSQSGERAVAGVTSGLMRLDDTVTWQATHFRIPFRMTSRITEYEAPVGPIGRLADRVVLTSYLTRLLERRSRWLVEALAAGGVPNTP